MSDEENPIKSWTGSVPEFFYDLISRVPPGVFLVIAVLVEYEVVKVDQAALFQDNGALVAFLGLLVLGAGYSIGIFLSAPGRYASRVYFSRVWKRHSNDNTDLLKRFIELGKINLAKKSDLTQLTNEEYLTIYRRMHDYLKFHNEHAKRLLPKMSAETSLCNNSAAAFTVWSIIHLIRSMYLFFSYNVPIQWSWFVAVVPFILILLWIGKERYDRLISSHFSFLSLTLDHNKE